MASPKVFTPFGACLFDFHVGVAISDDLYLIALFSKHGKLFVFAGRPFLLVIARKGLATIDESPRLSALYI